MIYLIAFDKNGSYSGVQGFGGSWTVEAAAQEMREEWERFFRNYHDPDCYRSYRASDGKSAREMAELAAKYTHPHLDSFRWMTLPEVAVFLVNNLNEYEGESLKRTLSFELYSDDPSARDALSSLKGTATHQTGKIASYNLVDPQVVECNVEEFKSLGEVRG